MTAALPLAELIVIDDPQPHPADLNMAIDEALLAGLQGVALLRCYRWSAPSVSFGCFGSYASVRYEFPEHDLVRRWTGGGIVEHAADFTFSLMVPRPLLLATLTSKDSYCLIHGAVAKALSRAGLCGIELAEAPTLKAGAVRQGAPFLKACFENPVAHDLMLGEHKIVGGAQRRTKSALLYQGSIQGQYPPTSLDVSFLPELGKILADTFALRCSSRSISLSEFALAERLAVTKYGAPAWQERV